MVRMKNINGDPVLPLCVKTVVHGLTTPTKHKSIHIASLSFINGSLNFTGLHYHFIRASFALIRFKSLQSSYAGSEGMNFMKRSG